ncbi:MAG: hypothetical protein CMP82_16130 [Gammaproteobacteria bacterium]|nr:hypothetical protein [Gammaproteobacteria bacterium]
MAWRTIISKFPGTCIVCDNKFEQDEVIHWDPDTKKAKHKDCETVKDEIDSLSDEINSLKDKALSQFVVGNLDEAMKLYTKLSNLEFKKLVKQHDVTEDMKFDEEKLAELNKRLQSSQLKQQVHNMDFATFLAEFKDTFLSLVRATLGDNEFVRISKNLESKKNESFQHQIAIKYYTEWTKKESYHISPDTPVTNKKNFSRILSKCKNNILWEDRYMDKDTITYLLSGAETAIKEIKLLSSIFSGQIDKDLKNYFEIVKKEMGSYNIDCQMKLITSKEIHGGEHDRYILGTNIGYNLPSVGQIKKDQKSDIFQIDRAELEKRKDDFFKLWNDSECKDIINDWDEIYKQLLDENLSKTIETECSECHEPTIIYRNVIKKGQKPLCKKCLRKRKRY